MMATLVPSTNTVAYHLLKLRVSGYVTWTPGQSRTLRATGLEPPR